MKRFSYFYSVSIAPTTIGGQSEFDGIINAAGLIETNQELNVARESVRDALAAKYPTLAIPYVVFTALNRL